MRTSTILLAAFTTLFGAATVVLAVLIGPADELGFVQTLRIGGVVTLGFAAGLLTSVVNRRRRDRLQRKSIANPGTVFVAAHATDTTAAELAAWSPGLTIPFPCDFGFDRSGLASWPSGGESAVLIAAEPELVGFDVFDQRTPLGSTSRWGITIHLAPRVAEPAVVHVWLIDEQPAQDEYTMRRMISRIETALGR